MGGATDGEDQAAIELRNAGRTLRGRVSGRSSQANTPGMRWSRRRIGEVL
jgi:hypothetical protein